MYNTCQKQKNIRTSFWLQPQRDLRPADHTFPDLRPLSSEPMALDVGEHDNTLVSIIDMIVADAIALRPKGLDRLEMHLCSCRQISIFRFYALLVTSQEGLVVTMQSSYRMQFAILSYIARFTVHEFWPEA